MRKALVCCAVGLLSLALPLVAAPALPASAAAAPEGWSALGAFEPLHDSEDLSCRTTVSDTTPVEGTTFRVRCYKVPFARPVQLDGIPDEAFQLLEVGLVWWDEGGAQRSARSQAGYDSGTWHTDDGGEFESDSFDGTGVLDHTFEGHATEASSLEFDVVAGPDFDTSYSVDPDRGMAVSVKIGVVDYPGSDLWDDYCLGHSERCIWFHETSRPVGGSSPWSSPRSIVTFGDSWPSWPARWPEGAVPELPVGVELPDTACRSEVRESPGGGVYVNLHGTVQNGTSPPTDEAKWVFSWDKDSGESTEEYYLDPEYHDGWDHTAVTVPMEGEPEGGWVATLVVVRQVPDSEVAALVNRDAYASDWDEPQELDGVWGLEDAIWVPPAAPSVPQYAFWAGYGTAIKLMWGFFVSVDEGPELTDDGFVWQLAEAHCSVRVRTSLAGTPDGDTYSDPDPLGPSTGDGECPDVDDDGWPDCQDGEPDGSGPGGEGTDGACKMPSGILEKFNPFHYVGMIFCVLDELLERLLDLLASLFIPQTSVSERLEELGDELQSSPIGEAQEILSDLAEDAQSSLSSASGGDCHGPTLTIPASDLSTHFTDYEGQPLDACEGPANTLRNIVVPLSVAAVLTGAIRSVWNRLASLFGAGRTSESVS